MTIPYNASRRSIAKYIKDSLDFIDSYREELDEAKYVTDKETKKKDKNYI